MTHLDLHSQLFRVGQRLVVRQRHQPDLIQGIRGVGDELSQEDLECTAPHMNLLLNNEQWVASHAFQLMLTQWVHGGGFAFRN